MIENDEVEMVEKKKPRARKKKVAKQSIAAYSLLKALKFVAVTQKKVGTVSQQFCMIAGNWIAASNEVLTVGCKIEEDLNACPHTLQLIDALNKCKSELSITQISQTALSVKSDKFKAIIPCVGFNEIGISEPDPQMIEVGNEIKAALEEVMCLATEGAATAYLAGVLLDSQYAVATDSTALIQSWHGTYLPGPVLIPKSAAQAVVKADQALVGMGASESGASVTFWFEDGSFIKSQLFNERYPNFEELLNVQNNPWELPEEFFEAVSAVESFSKDGAIFFKNGFVLSKDNEEEATSYCIEGLPEGLVFNANKLLMLKHVMKKVDFDTLTGSVYFFSGTARGILRGME